MLPQIITGVPGPKSKLLANRLEKVESPNITWVNEKFPIFWEKANGSLVFDVDGNSYLDMTAGFGVMIAGHGEPSIAKAVEVQSSKLTHGMGDVHPPSVKVDFLEKIAEICPGNLSQTILASTGAEAVEAALKTAIIKTSRTGFIAFEGAYHGLTTGALSVTERKLFRQPFENILNSGVKHFPFPENLGKSSNEILASIKIHIQNNKNIAAIILEPIQGRAGIRPFPKEFLVQIRQICSANDVLLIFDEIFCGLARTGYLFAADYYGVIPDILCIGKALGGGLPLSACISTPEIMSAWGRSNGEAIHTSTFLGHPLACATGIAILDLISKENFSEKAKNIESKIRKSFQNKSKIKEIHGLGAILGIELASAIDSHELSLKLLQKGVIALAEGERNLIALSPPLNISDKQLNYFIETFFSLI